MSFNQSSKKWFTFSLILSIWLNSLIPLFSTASLLSSINNQASDAILICTSTGFKWVSKSAMYETQMLVFLDTDEQTNTDFEHSSIDAIDCPLVILADQHNDAVNITVVPFLHAHNFIEQYTARPFYAITFPVYSTPQLRAPPTFS